MAGLAGCEARARRGLGWLRMLLLLLCVSGAIPASAQPLAAACPVRVLAAMRPDLTSLRNVCYVQDERRTLAPEDVLSGRWPVQRRDADQLVFTHTRAAYWVYLPLRNADGADRMWFLRLDYPLLDEVDFWIYDLDRAAASGVASALVGTARMGDGRPFAARPVRHRLFLLPLTFRPGQSLGVVIRVHSSGAINIPLSLHTAQSALTETQDQALAHGLFLGGMLLLAVFNLTLFLRLRKPQPFYNAAYIVCAGLFLTSMSGLGFQYLWPDSPRLANLAVPLTEVLAILSLLAFTRHFLDVRDSREMQWLKGFFAMGAALLAACFWVPYSVMVKVNTVYALVAVLAMLAVGIVQAGRGSRGARWYVASWLVFYVGFLLYGLAAFGYMPGFMAQERWMQAAVGAQIFLLTYAEIVRLRGLLDRALRIESSARSALQREVQSRTADLRATMGALQQANQQLRELTRQDPLTSLLNRRGLDEALDEMLDQSTQGLDPQMVLVVFDLDHFKRVNDLYGHDAGDAVLKWVAEVLRNLLRRKSDVLARFGGEEFVALLPGTSLADAAALVRGVLDHVRRNSVDLGEGGRVPLTLSAGAAAWRPGDTPQSLFRRADECLYLAKDTGRDRLVTDSGQDDVADLVP